jgi:hypothetical protein
MTQRDFVTQDDLQANNPNPYPYICSARQTCKSIKFLAIPVLENTKSSTIIQEAVPAVTASLSQRDNVSENPTI